jgi:SIR2-like domain
MPGVSQARFRSSGNRTGGRHPRWLDSTMYQPLPLSEPAGSVAAEVAGRARDGALTIYAGAGVSTAPPTSLPGAAGLAARIADRLQGDIPLDGVDRANLLAVADAVAAQPLGLQLLQRTIREVADLLGAHFNYAHCVLGLLLAEGAATVFETNYDDCIERAAQPEVTRVIRTAADLVDRDLPALLKGHGCATLPSTILATSAQLAAPPLWAEAIVQARLMHDRVVFLGIGSVADYVQDGLDFLLATVGDGNLLVADPAMAHWDDTSPPAWRGVLPALQPAQRDDRRAEEFLDAVLRAYLMEPRKKARQLVAGLDEHDKQRRGLTSLLEELERKDAVTMLRWLRGACHRVQQGEAIAKTPAAVQGILALGCLVGDSWNPEFGQDGWITAVPAQPPASASPPPESGSAGLGAHQVRPPDATTGIPILTLLVTGHEAGTGAAAEARYRVQRARNRSAVSTGADVIVLCTGHMGSLDASEVIVQRGDGIVEVLAKAHSDSLGVPNHLIADSDPEHIIDNSMAGDVLLVNGANVVVAV